MEKWVKWFCIAAAVATALSLYPFLAGETIGLYWAWYEVGFEATAEQETEILPEQLEEIGQRIEETHPQFMFAEPRPCAFVYNGETYILSPEMGILFLPGWETDDAACVRLTEPWKRHEGLYAFGAVQEEDDLYFVQAKERKRFCMFALPLKNTVFPETYRLEYRGFGLDTMETEPLEKAEYMAVRERNSLWE